MEKPPKNLWKDVYGDYQQHVIIFISEPEDLDERVVYIEDLEKRKQDNFKNWSSGNKIIDEFIQQSQLNAVHYKKCLEWIPFEKFQNITYIAEGGFGKIYSAEWPEGFIWYWDIKNHQWYKHHWDKYALKSLKNSSNISSDFLNEIKSYLQIYLNDIIQCYGITQDSNTREYIMVLKYCSVGNLRNYLNTSKHYINYATKIDKLKQIARGLLDIHNAGKKRMCQPANKEKSGKEEGIYGVLPYMAPEALREHQYTKAADIYSFGIVMNEFLSEEIPFNDIPHDEFLVIKICIGFRPKISEDIPKLLTNLIIRCWDAEIKNRPTTKELYQVLTKWRYGENSELYSQIKECDKNGEQKFKNRLNKDKSKNIHKQFILVDF
ncbi:hypothetical protein RclHR1_01980008 [Rhizophagus clarus]|uniref:Protein kinase domain-containing protein n=1 Tax=Rhizophagus clarus TaxID=94130 RepID=A0A2Z6QP91_9GLOM|nr:hypothetical protein RclHR1_01980008 [Rhizophagus clarus]